LYIQKENKTANYQMKLVPLDDIVSTDFIIPRSKDCQKLFKWILANNKAISKEGRR
jgi:hypothetical protein